MRFGVVVPTYGRFGDPDAVRTLIQAAEELGYDGAWFSDHVAIPDYATDWIPPPQLEALATCSVGIGATTRLRFGVDVLVAAYRHPLLLAAMAATADQLSGGRLVLGIGVGYLEGEFAALGVPYHERGALADEVLTVLGRAWHGDGPVSHPGPRWAFDAVHPGIRPHQPGGVPLWVGGNAERAHRRAALLGDGWHPLWPAPEDYATVKDRIVRWRADAGIDRAFTFSMSCPRTTLLGGSGDEPPMAAPGRRSRPARPEYGYVPPVPADAGRPRFTGTADQLCRDVEAYAAAGVEYLTVRLWTTASAMGQAELLDAMASFAEGVAGRAG